jgi:hypothetical protein
MFNRDSKHTAYEIGRGKSLQRNEKLYSALMQHLLNVSLDNFQPLENYLTRDRKLICFIDSTSSTILEFGRSRLSLDTLQPKGEVDQLTIRCSLCFSYHMYFIDFDEHDIKKLFNRFKVLINET